MSTRESLEDVKARGLRPAANIHAMEVKRTPFVEETLEDVKARGLRPVHLPTAPVVIPTMDPRPVNHPYRESDGGGRARYYTNNRGDGYDTKNRGDGYDNKNRGDGYDNKKDSVGVLDHRWTRVQKMCEEERCRVKTQCRMFEAMEKRVDVKISAERKKRLEMSVQASLQIQAVKNETISLVQQERREEIALLRQQLVAERCRVQECENFMQQCHQQMEKLTLTVCQLQDTCALTKTILTKEQELRKTMESKHLMLLKEYHATSTAAISVERSKREKMELSVLRFLESACGKVEDACLISTDCDDDGTSGYGYK